MFQVMTLSEMFFANTCPQAVACLFSLLTMSFEMQEILTLMKQNLSICYFTDCIDQVLMLYLINLCNLKLQFIV